MVRWGVLGSWGVFVHLGATRVRGRVVGHLGSRVAVIQPRAVAGVKGSRLKQVGEAESTERGAVDDGWRVREATVGSPLAELRC